MLQYIRMSLLFWGLTFGVVGKVTIGIAVMMVHWRIVKEHRIDRIVLTEMRRGRNVALLGIVLMVVGYILELLFYGFVPGFESQFEGLASIITY